MDLTVSPVLSNKPTQVSHRIEQKPQTQTCAFRGLSPQTEKNVARWILGSFFALLFILGGVKLAENINNKPTTQEVDAVSSATTPSTFEVKI